VIGGRSVGKGPWGAGGAELGGGNVKGRSAWRWAFLRRRITSFTPAKDGVDTFRDRMNPFNSLVKTFIVPALFPLSEDGPSASSNFSLHPFPP